MAGDVCFGSLADMTALHWEVCFTPESIRLVIENVRYVP